jgi:hypothetical protein
MSRLEVYPWSTLEKVGDYFVVTSDFEKKPAHYFMNATVAQRNKHMQGRMKYSCIKTSYGCIVMVVQVEDHIPPYDYEVIPGIYAKATFDHTATQPLGDRPKNRELTMQEKIDRLPYEVKLANLPWWWEKGEFRWNGELKKKRREDVDAFFAKDRSKFQPNMPYPEFYNLGEDFRIRTEEFLDDEEEPVDGEGEDAVFDEEQESGGNDE